MNSDLMLPAEKFTHAYEMFMDHLTSTEICEQLDVTEGQLRSWVGEGDWLGRREQIVREAVAKADSELRATVIQERMPVVRAQLGTAEKLAKKADSLIDSAEGGRDLADIARGFKTAADVQQKILGIEQAGKDVASGGKPKVVMQVFATRVERAPEPKPVSPVIDLPVDDDAPAF